MTHSVCKEQGHGHFGGRRAHGERGGNLGERRVFLTEESVEEGLHDGVQRRLKEVSELTLMERDGLCI